MKKVLRYLHLWLPIVAWCGLIYYLSSFSRFDTGLEELLDLILKKGAHVFEYGVLTFLLCRAISNTIKKTDLEIYSWTGFLSIIYAISDEVHQSFVPMRRASMVDVFIDSIGIIVAIFIVWRMRLWKKQ